MRSGSGLCSTKIQKLVKMVIASRNILFVVAFALLVLTFAFPTEARRLSTKASSNLVHDENENKGTLFKNVKFGMLAKIPILPPYSSITPITSFHPTLKVESVKPGPNSKSINFGTLPKNVPSTSSVTTNPGPVPTSPGTDPTTPGTDPSIIPTIPPPGTGPTTPGTDPIIPENVKPGPGRD